MQAQLGLTATAFPAAFQELGFMSVKEHRGQSRATPSNGSGGMGAVIPMESAGMGLLQDNTWPQKMTQSCSLAS